MVGGCASHDICLNVLGFFRCPILGGLYGVLLVVGWADPESEPQLKMCCLYEVIHDLETFLSHISNTYVLSFNA